MATLRTSPRMEIPLVRTKVDDKVNYYWNTTKVLSIFDNAFHVCLRGGIPKEGKKFNLTMAFLS